MTPADDLLKRKSFIEIEGEDITAFLEAGGLEGVVVPAEVVDLAFDFMYDRRYCGVFGIDYVDPGPKGNERAFAAAYLWEYDKMQKRGGSHGCRA